MRFLITALGALTFIATASMAHAGPLDQFAGRWGGWGQLTTTGGATEKLKCVANYKVAKGGNKARQTFRCAGPGYRIDAVVNYQAKGNRLTGTWSESIYSAGGALNGTIKGGRIRMSARSETFVVGVNITSASCKQTIDIRPQGGVEIQSILVSVKRC